MKRKFTSLTLFTLLGVGVTLGSPVPFQATASTQSQEQAVPGPQEHAVPAQRPDPDPNRQISMLTKRLNLTVDQQNQILPILKDRARQVENLRSDSSLSAHDRHTRIQAVRQDADSRISAVLTADQKQAFEQLQQQARERAREHRQERRNPSQATANAS